MRGEEVKEVQRSPSRAKNIPRDNDIWGIRERTTGEVSQKFRLTHNYDVMIIENDVVLRKLKWIQLNSKPLQEAATNSSSRELRTARSADDFRPDWYNINDIILLCMFLYYTFTVINIFFLHKVFSIVEVRKIWTGPKKWTGPVLVRAFRLDPGRLRDWEALKSVLKSLKVLQVTFDL